jgi:hypothetical protein
MNKVMRTSNGHTSQLFAILLLLVIQPESFGKRLPPKPVSPVTYGGIEYSSQGDGKVGWIAATDVASGKQLWTARVFRIHTHWWKGEEDNQWIFISDLKLDSNALLIRDERSRCYRLDLSAKRVKAEPCR